MSVWPLTMHVRRVRILTFCDVSHQIHKRIDAVKVAIVTRPLKAGSMSVPDAKLAVAYEHLAAWVDDDLMLLDSSAHTVDGSVFVILLGGHKRKPVLDLHVCD